MSSGAGSGGKGARAVRVEELFEGSGTREVLRAVDWSRTSLGPVSDWPEELVQAIGLMLPSRMPMAIWWGPDLVQIYNDAFARVVGDKHPGGLVQPAAECWAEVWDDLSPLVDRVIDGGESTFAENMLLLLDRHGYLEETYWTFSYSPISQDGRTQGMLIVATDSTRQLVGDRRLETVRQIGAVSAATSGDVEGTCRAAIDVLAGNRQAVPFAATYLLEPESDRVRMIASYGIGEGTELTPGQTFPLAASPAIATAVSSGARSLVTGLRDSSPPGALATSPLGEAIPDAAVVIPINIGGRSHVAAVAVLGVNPYRAVDDIYLTFFQLAGRQLRVALTDAATVDLERRRAIELEEIDEDKTRFYQNVSHEFRTPLTLILGPVRAALEDPALVLPERHRQGLESVARAGMRLRKLVESLLEFARVEASEAKLEPEPTDLAELTADLASMFRSVIEHAGLSFEVDVRSFHDVVEVDREMWAKIVLNLLSNAVKFTQRGCIRVQLRAEGDTIRLSVQDTGIGIPAGQLNKVFDRFTQVSSRSGRSAEGSGIGLALVASLATAHGGTAGVESVVGVGSTFSVVIPLVRSADPGLARAARAGTDPALEAYSVEASGWLRASTSAEAVDAAGERHLLLVEDNADMRSYLEAVLAADGWTVQSVGDVDAALAADPVPDIVVSDVMLPGRSGLDLLRMLRADTRLRRIPVILLSARSGPDAATEGLELGADDYVVKPFDPGELLARLRVHHELAKLRDYEVSRAEGKAANLGRALASNRRIGIAIGVLITRELVTAEEAFDRLRETSQRLNRKLYDVADEVVLTGMLPTE